MEGGDTFAAWVGRQRVVRDTLHLERARKLAATLDLDPVRLRAGDPLPLGWHWIYFHEAVPRSALAEDGHERRGDFLPPVPLPRRMWAGGRLDAGRPLAIGAEVERVSTIRSVDLKEGRSGSLAFVTVEHRYSDGDGVALVEEQDVVYLESKPKAPDRRGDTEPQSESPAALLERFTADEVTLFRFSALTFNGHRIHYDRSYTTGVEGYPGLIVHGPLQATLLLELLRRELPGARVTAFSFRALRPVFDTAPITVCGRPGDDDTANLWIRDADGAVAMEATATLA